MKSGKYPIASMFDAAEPFPIPRFISNPPDPELQFVISSLYEAALGNDDRWAVALEKLRGEFSARGVVFACPHFEKGIYIINVVSIEDFGTLDIANYEQAALKDEGMGLFAGFNGCCLSSDIHRAKGSCERRIANGEVAPNLARHASITRVEPPYWDTLMILRSIEDPKFTQEECDRLGACYNDFRRIAMIVHARAEILRENIEGIDALEALDAPFGLADGNGEIIFLNDAAKQILEFEAQNPFSAENWSIAAHKAVKEGFASFEISKVSIKLSPLIAPKQSDGFGLLNYSLSKILMVFDDVGNETTDIFPKVARKYRLSPAESEILRYLVSGRRPEEIAQSRSKSIDTIRTQLRSLRAKTNAKSQIELVALITNFNSKA